MCLLALAIARHPRYRLVLIANRDEFHARPSAPAAYWDPREQHLGGRDLQAGGSWLAVGRDGRFAAVTNFRDPAEPQGEARSRGLLVREFIQGSAPPQVYIGALGNTAHRYRAFNLIAGDAESVWYTSNRGMGPRRLDRGCYGLSNHLLDTPWPKVVAAKHRLAAILDAEDGELDPEPLLALLGDAHTFPDRDLPDTGIGSELERRLSPIFIRGGPYGTRCSTVWLVRADGHVRFIEQGFDAQGRPLDRRSFEFEMHAVAA
jgi:uncharacterized protein with NRDE domain